MNEIERDELACEAYERVSAVSEAQISTRCLWPAIPTLSDLQSGRPLWVLWPKPLFLAVSR